MQQHRRGPARAIVAHRPSRAVGMYLRLRLASIGVDPGRSRLEANRCHVAECLQCGAPRVGCIRSGSTGGRFPRDMWCRADYSYEPARSTTCMLVRVSSASRVGGLGRVGRYVELVRVLVRLRRAAALAVIQGHDQTRGPRSLPLRSSGWLASTFTLELASRVARRLPVKGVGPSACRSPNAGGPKTQNERSPWSTADAIACGTVHQDLPAAARCDARSSTCYSEALAQRLWRPS